LNCYCIPTHGTHGTWNCTSYVLSHVTFNTLNHNPSCPNTIPYYFNNSPTGNATTTVNAGNSYVLSITSGVNQFITSYNSVATWIDYNQDGFFSSDEYISIYPHYAANTDPWTGTTTVTIPTSALPGLTRMRISTNYSFATNYSNSSCLAYDEAGMTED